MALYRKSPDGPFQTLGTTGTVIPNSRQKKKKLTMTGNVTLEPPNGQLWPGDEYVIDITLGGFVLTLDAAYVSVDPTPPTILERCRLGYEIQPDLTILYWVIVTGA